MHDPSSSEPELASALPPVRELSFEEHYNLGRAARDGGNSDDALRAFSQALALQPSDPDCLEAVALLYRDKGLSAPAADFMRQSYCLTPGRQDRLEVFVALLDDLIDFEQDEVLDEFFQSEAIVPQEILEKTEHLSGLGIQAIRKRFPEFAPAQTSQDGTSIEETPLEQPDAVSVPAVAESELVAQLESVVPEEEAVLVDAVETSVKEPLQEPTSSEPVSSDLEATPELLATAPEESPQAVADWLTEPEPSDLVGLSEVAPELAEEALFAVDLASPSPGSSLEMVDAVVPSAIPESLEKVDSAEASGLAVTVEEPPVPETASEPSSLSSSHELVVSANSAESAEILELQASLEELQSDLLRRGLELESQHEQLEQQKADLLSREQKLSELEQQLQSKSVQVQWETEELQVRQQKLSQRELDLTTQQSAIEASLATIAEKENELLQKAEALSLQEEAARAREAAVAKQEAELVAKLKALENLANTPVPQAPVLLPVQTEPPVSREVVLPAAAVTVASAPSATVVTIPSLAVQAEPATLEVAQPAPAEVDRDNAGPSDLAALSLLLDKDPEYANSVELAWQLSKENESDFLALFRELSRPSNADPRHSRNFALAYLHQNRPLLAVVQLQKYLQKSPSASGYRLLADVYQRMNRQSNVEDCLRRAEALEAQG
jgi:tetratricopeptide (TPR) repeat protein